MNYLSSLAVANWFLDKKPNSTVMRLQRLTYFSHCWCLVLYNRPLTDEFVSAFRWGPVFPSIYDAAKEYGSGPINYPLSEPLGSPPTISEQDPRIPLLLKIQEIYGSYSDSQLSRIATEENGPWHTTIVNHPGRKKPNIDENLISSYFKSKIQNDHKITDNRRT